MAQDHEQLVRLITREVEAALRGNGRGRAVGEPATAAIHPPIGICTGDYSKFEELRGKPDATGGLPASAHASKSGVVSDRGRIGGQAASGTPAAGGTHDPQPLRGIVVAKHLEGRGKVVRLTPCARLTPLAVDYVKQNGITVERGNPSNPGAAAQPNPKPAGPWVWWCDGHEPMVDKVTDQLRGQLKPLSHQRSAGALAAMIKQLAKRVRGGEAAGGVLFVETAARAACFANRCPSLRAVVGTCGEAVEQGVRLLGANVLIVEHPYHGWKSMREMAGRFIAAPRQPLGDVDRQLRELAECD